MQDRGFEVTRSASSRAKDELRLEDGLQDLLLESIVDVLAVVESAKATGEALLGWLPGGLFGAGRGDARAPGMLGASRLRNFLFDVTLLGVDSARDLSRIGRRYLDYFVGGRRPIDPSPAPAAPSTGGARAQLVTLERAPADCRFQARFRLSNETSHSGAVSFPRLLSFSRPGSATPVSVTPVFEPASVRLEPGEEISVAVTIDDRAERLRPGHTYAADGTVLLTAGPALLVVFEVRA